MFLHKIGLLVDTLVHQQGILPSTDIAYLFRTALILLKYRGSR